jgi:hypothetical protein
MTNWSITRTFGIPPKIVSLKELFMIHRPRGAKPQVIGAQGPAGQPHFESVQAET